MWHFSADYRQGYIYIPQLFPFVCVVAFLAVVLPLTFHKMAVCAN
jgi:hypothetical protein